MRGNIMNNKPQAGFATTASQATAAQDGFQTFQDAVSVDQVFDALQTEAGRQAVGA